MRNAIDSIGSARRAQLIAALSILVFAAGLVMTQTAAAQGAASTADSPAEGDAPVPLSADALEELVGPIALYPDDLIGIVLPASTYPLQIVQAARFLEDHENDSSLEPDEDWDNAVVALLNYPEVLQLMNDDLDWTWALGEAVLYQRADVLDAIQGFRDRAYAAGNLRSDDRQVVTNDEGVIEIAPADPEVIYIPYYEPRRVVVYQSAPAYHYYPWSYPLYYYPYPAGYSFHSGFFWGVTTAFTIGWHSHFLHLHHHHFHGHPYFGYSYYDPFYVRRGLNINVNLVNNVWEPRHWHGARPYDRISRGVTRVDGARVTRSTGGRVDGARVTRSTGGRVDGTPPGDSRRSGVYRSGSAEPRTSGAIDRRQTRSSSEPVRRQVGDRQTRATEAPDDRAVTRVAPRTDAGTDNGGANANGWRGSSRGRTQPAAPADTQGAANTRGRRMGGIANRSATTALVERAQPARSAVRPTAPRAEPRTVTRSYSNPGQRSVRTPGGMAQSLRHAPQTPSVRSSGSTHPFGAAAAPGVEYRGPRMQSSNRTQHRAQAPQGNPRSARAGGARMTRSIQSRDSRAVNAASPRRTR